MVDYYALVKKHTGKPFNELRSLYMRYFKELANELNKIDVEQLKSIDFRHIKRIEDKIASMSAIYHAMAQTQMKLPSIYYDLKEQMQEYRNKCRPVEEQTRKINNNIYQFKYPNPDVDKHSLEIIDAVEALQPLYEDLKRYQRESRRKKPKTDTVESDTGHPFWNLSSIASRISKIFN